MKWLTEVLPLVPVIPATNILAVSSPKKREAILFKIQQLMHEKVMFAPIVEPAFLDGYGAKVADPALGLIVGHLYSATYEDLRLKK